MLKYTEADTHADAFKCVGCGTTAPGRRVDGAGPLDIEQRAEDMYSHAVGVLHQQVGAHESQTCYSITGSRTEGVVRQG